MIGMSVGVGGLADQLQVLVRPDVVVAAGREVGERLGEALGARRQPVVDQLLLLPHLLLENGEHDHGGGAGVFHLP